MDVYGRKHKILPKSEDGFQWLSENYKFYLSFENSNCRDYITEKVSRNALQYVSYSVSVSSVLTLGDDYYLDNNSMTF